MVKKPVVYPYIPNSVPEIKAQMLREIGASSVEDIYTEIPHHLRFKGKLNVPGPFPSEYELRRHIEALLHKNKNCKEHLNFLGGGCWQHYVPSVCTTIMERDEFLTAYCGESMADHGKFQAQFEYASCMAELLDMDMVNTPTYDWGMAAATSVRMASRITGRNEALIVKTVAPDRLACIKNYAWSIVPNIKLVETDAKTGLMDLEDLKRRISPNTALVYFENPSYLGFIESQGTEISKIAHDAGAIVSVGVDPISLGVLEPPARYGADIAVGEIQPLGIPMYWGGGLGGFVATRDEPEYVAEFPSLLFGITDTTQEGEYGFGAVYFERTSFASREKGKDFVGTMAQLHGIIAGVYLSLMGPQGMRELGKGILQRVQYAIDLLSGIDGIKAPVFQAPHFKEFVVNFEDTGKSVRQVNRALLEKNIFGGKDLCKEFPQLGQSALYCVTEIHTKEDLERLAEAIREVV
jgi:glycine dehydrogenase subunit 1